MQPVVEKFAQSETEKYSRRDNESNLGVAGRGDQSVGLASPTLIFRHDRILSHHGLASPAPFFAPFDDQEKDQWSAAARASTVARLVGMDS